MENLTLAAQAGNTDRLYELIAENPTLLTQIDEIPLVNTPLHVAAEAGCTHFAVEIWSLKPSFGRKLNPNGLSPLHLALRNGHDEMVKRLIEIDSELIRVNGKGRWTPLHYVARMDNVDLLADFLLASPLSIDDVTIRKENALHIAAANGKIGALEVLMGWIKRTDNQHLLRTKDEKGNTLLHVVASNCQLYADGLINILVKLKRGISTAERNSDGLNALDIISRSQLPHQLKEAAKKVLQSWDGDLPPPHSLSKYLRSERSVFDTVVQIYFRTNKVLTSQTVNSILVVVTLIITASYQSAFQPPTGLNGGDSMNSTNTTATVIHNHNRVKPGWSAFYTFNSVIFAVCVSIIIVVIEFNFISLLMHLTLVCMYANYVMLVYTQDVNISVKRFTSITFIISYNILVLKVTILGKGILKRNLWKLIAREISYIVEMQHAVISRKLHGAVGTRN